MRYLGVYTVWEEYGEGQLFSIGRGDQRLTV